MNLDNLRDVFYAQLKDMYSAEKQLSELLPELAQASSSEKLQRAFEFHHAETERQMTTLHAIMDSMGVNPGNTKCEAMEGLVKEARDMASKDGDADARDAGIICAAQKAEHYEIATYGSLRTWALLLEEEEAAKQLQALLDQEYEADNALDKLAETYLNERAAE